MPRLRSCARQSWARRCARRCRLARAGRVSVAPAVASGAPGTVILPFGRYFAGRADMLTRDGFKTIVPIDGVSPFSGVGEPDPEMQHFADSERVNERVRTEVRKDLAARLAQADADYLVVDNSTALLTHREVNGRLYTVLAGEETDLMDTLWNADAAQARALAVKLSRDRLHRQPEIDLRLLHPCLPGQLRPREDHPGPVPRGAVLDRGGRHDRADQRRSARRAVPRGAGRLLHRADRLPGGRTAPWVTFRLPSQWQTFDHRLRRVIEAGPRRALHLAPAGRLLGVRPSCLRGRRRRAGR